jgi:tetratricopeptide (TPR) repeat protein
MEGRLRLGDDLCVAGRFADALARLQQAPKVEPEQAAPMFVEMAVASYGLRQVDEARRYADQARAAARTAAEKAEVERLLARIQAPSKTETRDPSVDPDRPTLRRAPPKKGGGGGMEL